MPDPTRLQIKITLLRPAAYEICPVHVLPSTIRINLPLAAQSSAFTCRMPRHGSDQGADRRACLSSGQARASAAVGRLELFIDVAHLRALHRTWLSGLAP